MGVHNEAKESLSQVVPNISASTSQDHQMLLDNFSFNNMIQVPTVANSRALSMLWDDDIVELDDVATTVQEIHAMVKVRTTNDS
ncbi:hypothetical protein H5410_056155 [Solanum commersonii]|uniref:Uncharacterized protein n=1 Tax=Solanum commersonii TaxID=4109 RepID=A0A9J5WKV8_SOLCO|nr:hypothetical protein H5410_056155 [Solanum commersonii]